LEAVIGISTAAISAPASKTSGSPGMKPAATTAFSMSSIDASSAAVIVTSALWYDASIEITPGMSLSHALSFTSHE